MSGPAISLDLVLLALSKTLLNPFVVSLFPLGLRAVETPYTATAFIITSLYATLVCGYHILAFFNRRIAYGPARKINWEKEVVVITGGRGGLGGCLAEIYALKGVSVAVIDIAVPKQDHGQEREGIMHYYCDLYDGKETEAVWAKIKADLGAPTILINNAATSVSASVKGHNHSQVERIFKVNTISQFLTVQLFLDSLPSVKYGGTIVTVSSVVAHLHPAYLAAYSASKAAVTTYNRTLANELARTLPMVKTILVAPGQLDTPLFQHMRLNRWLSRFVAPVVPAGELAIQIVRMIDTGRGGEIRMPFYAEWATLLENLPVSIQQFLRRMSGIDEAVAVSTGQKVVVAEKQAYHDDASDSSSLDDSDDSD